MSSLTSILNITKSIPLMSRISDRASDIQILLLSEERNGVAVVLLDPFGTPLSLS